MNIEHILQANPLAQYLAHREEIDAAIYRTLSSGLYILGDQTRLFEQEFARYIGVGHAVGVSSGTEALVLAFRACNIGPGDEVITTPHTAVATVAAIELAGATAVLADVEPDTFLLDPSQVESKVSPRTRAVVPVHLYGQPATLDRLLETCRRYKLRLIEDCAQAHGASFGSKKVGAWGDIGCFSFYPTKNLGAIGDGGIVVTSDDELAERVRALREYGWKERFISEVPGCNSRLDELQASILRVKLVHLTEDNEKRQRIADIYTRELSGRVSTPVVAGGRASVFHQYVVRVSQRDHMRQFLKEHGVGTSVHYPFPIHLQPAYRDRLGSAGSFPCAETAATEILSLPIYPELSDFQINKVVENIHQCCAWLVPTEA
jgi:dTDP-4-amino-4,6-dideoxygalactose transaminase